MCVFVNKFCFSSKKCVEKNLTKNEKLYEFVHN